METEKYESPKVEIIEVEVEKGFATSGQSGPDQWQGEEQL